MQLQGEFEGKSIGSSCGGETVLKKPGYILTGFDVRRGYYFGHQVIVHFQIVWKRLIPEGVDPNTTTVSDKLGGANYMKTLQPPREFCANADAFITDLAATTSFRTSGG